VTGLHRSSWRAAAALVAGAPLLSGCVVATSSRNDGSGAGFLLLFLPFLLFVVFAMRAFRGSRGTRRREQWHGGGRDTGSSEGVNLELLRAELSVLADDVIRLEPQVVLNEAARGDYEAATHRYRVAQTALESSNAPLDLVRVQRVVDEANWSMSRARAILDGRTPPAPPTPLQRPGPHGEPAIGLDEREAPVYVDSPAPFRSGWFGGGGGGLFGGLLLGSMLGGFGGWVVHDTTDEADGWFDDGGDADW
jgi:hypothetical protein